ncbi:component of SufBCD complex [Tabrizicola oligotrophica]|uniref:component of SufBCD complex n=1 Tax=Tabrizicola oligotrophica TaxID=2710650 RepID=UPI001D11DF6D|nr:component of SufBCD complex [Tabrizicola oligotrophica]
MPAPQADIWARLLQEAWVPVDWYNVIFELIDMRSFSNLWYWIVLAVLWSTASHWVLGVPFDMISRAKRHGGAAQEDLETMVRINTGRMLYITRAAGSWLVAIWALVATMLLLLGFVYDIEFAQAVLFLYLPFSLLMALSLRSAILIEAGEGRGDLLHRRLLRHRVATQVLGMVSIFVTSLFGMYQNMHIGVLG